MQGEHAQRTTTETRGSPATLTPVPPAARPGPSPEPTHALHASGAAGQSTAPARSSTQKSPRKSPASKPVARSFG